MKPLHRPTSAPDCRQRRGVAAIIIIAVLAMTMAFAGVWARRIVMERRAARRVEEQQQARWLAEAGVRRAAARLSADPTYPGEVWTIAADDIDRTLDAEIELTVKPDDSADGLVAIIAQARYPARQPRVRSTKTIQFTPPTREPQS